MLSAPSTYSTRTCPILRKDRMSESADNGNSMQGSPQANILSAQYRPEVCTHVREGAQQAEVLRTACKKKHLQC